ncbi:hypothetical protein C8R47DRAFT_994075 [Mycena vitilis]|nr:hypothetical protein C8R47DRAFT_994075 [Mycena vitilis]
MVGGDNADLKGQIFRAMMRAGELGGEVYFAIDDGSNQVVGVAVWFPPGKLLFDTEEQRTLGFDDLMNQLSIETKKFWAESYAPVVENFLADEKLLGPEGTRNSYYLNLLATDPAYQKKHIASTLLKTVHDKVRLLVPGKKPPSHFVPSQFAESDMRPLFAHCAANELTVCLFDPPDLASHSHILLGRVLQILWIY